MKKIILSTVALFAFGIASAQIKTDAGTFSKPAAGTMIMEVNFSPNVTGTTGGGIFSLQNISPAGLLGVKVRKFNSDKSALRLSGNLEVNNSSAKDAAGNKADTEFKVGVGIGMEHHMAGAERLSTYWGYEANLAYLSTNNADITLKNTAKFGLGAGVFTGFDYYIMPKVYLGAEVSYGVAVVNEKADGGDSVTGIKLAPGITPNFRLGWQF